MIDRIGCSVKSRQLMFVETEEAISFATLPGCFFFYHLLLYFTIKLVYNEQRDIVKCIISDKK